MKSLKSYLDSLTEGGIPYVDVVAHKEGREIAREMSGTAVGDEKLFMFSMTKPVTVALTMRLIEEGYIGLYDLAEKYIPCFKDVYLEENGVRRAPKKKPTIENLLTMSAGLTYDWDAYGVYDAIEKRGERSATVAAMSTFASAPLMCEVGVKMNYCLSHDALGAVAEIATGKKFSSLMSEYIFKPLGMNDTRFAGAGIEDVADVYGVKADGRILPSEKSNVYVFADGYESGGAGLISTLNDYIKFADMLALGGVGTNGARILSEKSIKDIYTPRFRAAALGGNYTNGHGDDYGYGLGVRTRMIETEWGLPIGEFGWDGAAGSFLMVDPKNKISVVVGLHLRNWPPVFLGKHLEIVKRIYGEL